MLPLGTVGRPDELGIVFALCAALSFRSQRVTNTATILGGMFLGLCGATSLGALLLLGPLVCWKPWQTASASSTRARWLLLAVVGALTAAAACIAPILISHPAAYRQLMAHAGEQSAALSWITRTARNSDSGFLNQWKGAPAFGPAYIILVVGLWAFAIMCWAFDKARTSSNYSSIVLTALSMLFLVVFMPGNTTTCGSPRPGCSLLVRRWPRRFTVIFRPAGGLRYWRLAPLHGSPQPPLTSAGRQSSGPCPPTSLSTPPCGNFVKRSRRIGSWSVPTIGGSWQTATPSMT